MAKKFRAFIAIEMPAAVQKRCLQIQSELANDFPGVKWNKPESLHITMLFLGQIDDKDLWKTCDLAKKACNEIKPFQFKLQGMGCFPNPRRARVVWLGVDPESVNNFQKLYDVLADKMEEQGLYRKEQRDFQPHLSLGRLNQQDLDFSVVCSHWKIHPWISDELDVKQVLVLSSEDMHDGPEYTKLAKIKL